MNKNLNLLVIGLLTMLLSSCTDSLDSNFTPLFNGVDMEGFYLKIRNGDENLAKKVFAVEDSTIHIFNHQFPDSIDYATGDNGTHGLFYTHKEYSKFILRFEYKWGTKIANNFNQYQYDAGCYYHVIDDKIWPVGIEYQVRYNHVKELNHTGDFWASKPLLLYASKDSSRFAHPAKGAIRVPKMNEVLASKTQNYNALNGEWNKCEVIVMEDKYAIHKLNGEIVNMATNLNIKKGKIGFQSETAEIFYRNIEIKEFEKLVPLKSFMD